MWLRSIQEEFDKNVNYNDRDKEGGDVWGIFCVPVTYVSTLYIYISWDS